jgi:hypothetical protein
MCSGSAQTSLTVMIRDAPDIRPDNPAFFISSIRPNTGFALPDTGTRIRPSYFTKHLNVELKIGPDIGYPACTGYPVSGKISIRCIPNYESTGDGF